MPSKSFRTSNSFFSQEEQKPTRTKLPKGMKSESTDPEPTEERASAPSIPEGYFKISRSEPKNKRIQLLITQTVYDKMKDRATAEGISFNELALRTFETFLESI